MTRKVAAAAVLVGLALSSPATAATPQTLKVILSGGFAQVYREVLPDFEKSTGIKVENGSGASEGDSPQTIRYQLAHGAKADVVILSREGLQKLSEDGRIQAGSEAGLATAPLAAAVRAGSPKPDISTDELFKKVLINAEQVVMPGSTSGQFVRDKVFPKLNLPASVQLTLVPRGTEAAEFLRSGKANLSMGPTSELIKEPGIQVIGALPDDCQIVQTFTAGIVNDAENPEAAKRLIYFLTTDSDHLLGAIKSAGMQPATRK